VKQDYLLGVFYALSEDNFSGLLYIFKMTTEFNIGNGQINVMMIDGGSYRTQDNTALIRSLKESGNQSNLIFVFVINPVYKKRTHQKYFISGIMKNMCKDFEENDINLHCFCDDVITVIKSITKTVKIGNLYINRSICYPEKLNVKKLQIVAADYEFELKISDDVFIQNLGQDYDHAHTLAREITYPIYIRDFINKSSPKHEHIPKPDCRELTELFALYNDSINYDDLLFDNEIDIRSNIDNNYNIGRDIWGSFDAINKKNNIDSGERFKMLNIKRSRQKGFKLLKRQKKYAESEDYYMLYPYIKHGILSIRELYHKLVDNCYNDMPDRCELNLSNSKIMSYLVRRDYNSQTHNHLLKIDTVVRRQMVNISAFIVAKTGIHIIDAGIRQMEIQGIIHPCVKIILYSFVRDATHINEQYFQKLIDYDYVIDHDMWINAEPFDMMSNIIDQYIKLNKLEEYMRSWSM
jgi:deoxyribodipyrimidine photolyase